MVHGSTSTGEVKAGNSINAHAIAEERVEW